MRVLSWRIMELQHWQGVAYPSTIVYYLHCGEDIGTRQTLGLVSLMYIGPVSVTSFTTEPFTTPPGFLPSCRSATPSVPKIVMLMNLLSLILLRSASLENILLILISLVGHSVCFQCKDCIKAVLGPNSKENRLVVLTFYLLKTREKYHYN